MADSVPFRSRASNTACATAAPAAFVLVATLAETPDACRTLLRGEVVGQFTDARRHALTVLQALEQRHRGANLDVQLLDVHGAPVLMIGSGPAAVVRDGEPDAVFSGLRCNACGWFLRPVHGATCPICGPAAGGAS